MHRKSFYDAIEVANKTAHPVPSDTRAWSQILVSLLTGINGIARKKGADLADGSDVKAANLWQAIDTPRFNGCIKSGRKGDMGNIEGRNEMPHLFFVMWDKELKNNATDVAFGLCGLERTQCFGPCVKNGTTCVMREAFAVTTFNCIHREMPTQTCFVINAETWSTHFSLPLNMFQVDTRSFPTTQVHSAVVHVNLPKSELP